MPTTAFFLYYGALYTPWLDSLKFIGFDKKTANKYVLESMYLFWISLHSDIMMSTHKTIFFAILIATSLFQCTSSLNFAGPPWFVFARQDIISVPPQPPPHSTSKNTGKTAVFPVLSLVAAQNSEEKKTFKEEMMQTVVKEVHLVVSRIFVF